MARIKKFSPKQDLQFVETFQNDEASNSKYFRITEFNETFTGGKNGFLIEGTPYLKESTEIKIEILDVDGNPIYYEPGDGIPEYYEGTSKVVAAYVYEDTPIGEANITILGELKEYVDDEGFVRDVPDEWKGVYNIKWEKNFYINRRLGNEDKVRFYRRPEVDIEEITKPIFLGTPPTITQSGSVAGLALIPNRGQSLSGFSNPTSYRLKSIDNQRWTGSILNETINFQDIDYSPTVTDIVSEDEIIVSPPYAPNDIVESFTSEAYTASFSYVEGSNPSATSLIGSFAKIKVTDLKTFVGDVANVKIYRRSNSQISDYEFVQEIQLESNEILRDIEALNSIQVDYGLFTPPVIEDYWTTSSVDIETSFDRQTLFNSVHLSGSEGDYFYTTETLDIEEGVEYTLDFNVLNSGSVDSNDFLRVFLSGSRNNKNFEQDIVRFGATTDILQKTNINENIIADEITSASLYFEVEGGDWYINSVSFKASEETSFSPDEITIVQQVPKILETETFEYRFDFYDINNNYIPVRVEKSKTFTGGNLGRDRQRIEVDPIPQYFAFDSGSNPLPPKTINLEVDSNALTGSLVFTSGAYDINGDLIPSSSYGTGDVYPGLLTDLGTDTPTLTVENFTGSLSQYDVQYVSYDVVQGKASGSFTISKVLDGPRGEDAFVIQFDPNPVLLGASPKGEILSYDPADTNIRVTQGERELVFTDSGLGGTFFTTSIQSESIDFGTVGSQGSPSMSVTDFSNMTELSASVTYNFEIVPFFTSSYVTRSVVQRFTKTPEGAGAIEVLLEPNTVTLNSDESGFLDAGDYEPADTTIIVRQDEEYLLYTGSGEPGTFQVSATENGIQTGSFSGSNGFGSVDDDTLNIVGFSNFTNESSASVDYEITVYPYSLKEGKQGVETTINKKQIFTKVSDGTAARNVRLLSSTTQVVYNQFNQVITPQGSIQLTANATNTTGSAYFTFKDGDGTVLQQTSTTNTYTPSDFPDPESQNEYVVELRDGSPTSQIVSTDSITITSIRKGDDTYQSSLSNPAASVNVDVGGEITDFSNTGTLIRAYKARNELQYSQSYTQTDLNPNALPIFENQFSASIFATSSYITVPPLQEVQGELYASHSVITDWETPQIFREAFITYKIDFENGESTQFVTQNISAVFAGETGPGIVVRGEWTGSVDYIYNLDSRRRDAVFTIENSDETHYWATTTELTKLDTPPPYTVEPNLSQVTDSGDFDDNGWEYLGQEDLFVAAKIAIFEESFIKNTLNVGLSSDTNPQITIDGSTDEPYISIGQTGIQGYLQEGIWQGINDAGTAGTVGKLSLRSPEVNGKFNSFEWNGTQAIIRGGLRQLPSGETYEPVNRGTWQVGAQYYSGSIVQYAPSGEPTSSWTAVASSVGSTSSPDTRPTNPTYWKIYAEGVAGSSGQNGSSGTDGSDGTSGEDGSNGTSGDDGSNGSDGNPGPGIVYRGLYDVTEDYFKTTERTDVVKSNNDGEYYIATVSQDYRGTWNSGTTYNQYDIVLYSGTYYINIASTPQSGNTPTNGLPWSSLTSSPDVSSGTISSWWDSFGATFESVATDILFSQQVYADQTVSIGSSEANSNVINLVADAPSNDNPYISIGQTTEDFLEQGIYMGYRNNDVVFSLVSGSNREKRFSIDLSTGDAKFENIPITSTGDGNREVVIDNGTLTANNVDLSGKITATDGEIGGFDIGDGILESSGDNLFSINGTDNELIVREESTNNIKFRVNDQSTLPNPESSDNPSRTGLEYLQGFTDSVSSRFSPASMTSFGTASLGTFEANADAAYTIKYVFEGHNTFSRTIRAAATGSNTTSTVSVRLQVREDGTGIQPTLGQSSWHSISVEGSEQQVFPSGGEIEPGEELGWEGVANEATLGPAILDMVTSLQDNTTYKIILQFRLNGVIEPSSNAQDANGYTPSIQGEVDLSSLSVSSTNPDINANPSYTIINGGGFQSVLGIGEYMNISSNNPSGRKAKIRGGLDVDSLRLSGSVLTQNPSKGMTYLPNGFILQFGYETTAGQSSDEVLITFPTAFPTACVSVSAHSNRDTEGASGFNHIHEVTNENFTAIIDVLDGTTQRNAYWMAIGY